MREPRIYIALRPRSLSPPLHFRPHAMRTFRREDKQRAILVRYVQRYTNIIALPLTGQDWMKERGKQTRKTRIKKTPERSKESQFHVLILVLLLLIVPYSPRWSRSPLLPRCLQKKRAFCMCRPCSASIQQPAMVKEIKEKTKKN